MRARLLGPLDVLTDAGPRLIVGRRRKAVLAILALNDGEIGAGAAARAAGVTGQEALAS